LISSLSIHRGSDQSRLLYEGKIKHSRAFELATDSEGGVGFAIYSQWGAELGR